jgi:succinoglycan biosynthesis transport protein ExoP
MPNPSTTPTKRGNPPGRGLEVSVEHYLRLILFRWWLVLITFVVVSAATVIITSRMPDIFTSYTTILVDPQKVPESYVKATVSGDVRNRLGTLSQQILSATRLQMIIDSLNLYPTERKVMVREDVISKMRSDITVSLVSDYGNSQDLQAFRITYSGADARLVAQVTTQLASLFIDENLKVREAQATGTTEFLANQLQDTRKALEEQEAKLRDFKLKHIGEMPEQETADLQLLGQLQSQLQLESEGLSRAEQQKSYLQSVMAQSTGVVDMDEAEPTAALQAGQAKPASGPRSQLEIDKARLAGLLEHGYSDRHPEVRRLKAQIAKEEADPARVKPPVVPVPPPPPMESAAAQQPVRHAAPPAYTNPVLQSQLKSVEDEIARHKSEQERLRKLVAEYRAKLEAIPVRQQQIAELARDYEISKAHYTQLLDKQLSAETATQLEVRQKGEQFKVLDSAQPAERPSRPNRLMLNSAGAAVGLGLGLLLALVTQFLGITITSPDQVAEATGLQVLEVIPVIRTRADKATLKRRMKLAAASGGVATVLAIAAALFLHFRGQI